MKKTMRIVLSLGLVLLMVMAFVVGCKKAVPKTLTIAFMPGIADPFYFTMERGIMAKAKELGVNVVVGDYPTAWGPAQQLPNLDALMAKGGIDLDGAQQQFPRVAEVPFDSDYKFMATFHNMTN